MQQLQTAHNQSPPPRLIGSDCAFTLIELSIVLVIIGLLAGSVLVGRDLIKAAEVRAEITQIEKYNQAVNIFKGKYNGQLPGDINATDAATFGFAARGAQPGMGNGDGVIAGFSSPTSVVVGWYQAGEPTMFWVDLSTANLIENRFNTASSNLINNGGNCTITTTTTPNINNYFPHAKIGQNNYVTVWSGGWSETDNSNYFSISSMADIGCWASSYGIDIGTSPGITVAQAYAIDSKTDDGLPQSGRVLAMSAVNKPWWANLPNNNSAPWTTPTPGSSSTCFDNSATASGTPGSSGAVQHYSIEMQNGAAANCTLSFKFQ